MNKLVLSSILFLVIGFFACKQDINEGLPLENDQTPPKAVSDRAICDRNAAYAGILAPSAGLSFETPLPFFDFGELNEHVNGCPFPYNSFSPKTPWTYLSDVMAFCDNGPVVSIAEQDAIIATTRLSAQNFLNQHPEINCDPTVGDATFKKKLAYRIHFEKVSLLCECTAEHNNSFIRAWVQLGCVPDFTPTKDPDLGGG